MFYAFLVLGYISQCLHLCLKGWCQLITWLLKSIFLLVKKKATLDIENGMIELSKGIFKSVLIPETHNNNYYFATHKFSCHLFYSVSKVTDVKLRWTIAVFRRVRTMHHVHLSPTPHTNVTVKDGTPGRTAKPTSHSVPRDHAATTPPAGIFRKRSHTIVRVRRVSPELTARRI